MTAMRPARIAITPTVHLKKVGIRGETRKELCFHVFVGNRWDRVHYSAFDDAWTALTAFVEPLLTGRHGRQWREPDGVAKARREVVRSADAKVRDEWSRILGRELADDEPLP